MKTLKKAITLLALLTIFIGFEAFPQKQFNGKWKILEGESDYGGLAKNVAAPKTIAVEIGDSIITMRAFENQPAFREALVFGAKEVETNPNGNTLRRAKVAWIKDNNSIKFDTYYEVDGNEFRYTRVETWSLSADGTVLTVYRVTTLPDKQDKVRAIYKKMGAN